MNSKAYASWVGLRLDAWSLGAEASIVAGLRMLRIATGGVPAVAETQLMVAEKIQAASELQTAAALGKLGATPLSSARGAVKHYRRKVSANRRRLSR